MDAPLPPPIVAVRSADCLCKPDCKCSPCKCVKAKTTGATVTKTDDGYKVLLPGGRVHYFMGPDWTEKGMIAFAETYSAEPMPGPAFMPGNCPGGVCPVR